MFVEQVQCHGDEAGITFIYEGEDANAALSNSSDTTKVRLQWLLSAKGLLR